MISRFLTGWGVAARLLTIALLPAFLMFLAVTATLYYNAVGDVRRDVAERGRLIATALAQSGQYGLVSGNVGYLHSTLHNLLAADRSIACIAIADAGGRQVAGECRRPSPPADSVAEELVRIESLPDVDLFEPVDGPPLPQAAPSGTPPRTTAPMRTVGRVRVTMSAAPIFESRRRAVMAASGLVGGAAVLSALVGLRLARRLRQTFGDVMQALRDIRRGQFHVDLGPRHDGELGDLQETIEQMADTLSTARHKLEQQVAERTQELQEAVDLVRVADAEKRRLIVHSNALVEEDRRRVALEIHDHLGAALISMRLEAAALLAKAEAAGDDDMARGARRIASTAESLYSSTRNIVKSLRPEVIDTLGLAGAVEEMVQAFDQIHPACRFSFQADARAGQVRGECAMPAYRVAQEALNNVVKHSSATQASVALSVGSDGLLHLTVRDNGRGFDTRSRSASGLGLIGMRERVAAVGGEMSIASAPGQGTTVTVTLPLPQRD